MIFDEPSQVLAVLNGNRLKTFDVSTGKLLYRIDNKHEAMTSGLWFGDSELIVTGSANGMVQIWACHHTDGKPRGRPNRGSGARKNSGSRCRRTNSRSKRRSRGASFRHARNSLKIPALIAQFREHSGAVTGLVRHGINDSLVVSSGADGTLRVWDVNRLTAVAVVPVAWPVMSFMAYESIGGHNDRLVCAGTEGKVSMMMTERVCQFLGDATHGARRLRYYPPLAEHTEGTSLGSDLPSLTTGRLVDGQW